MSSLGTVIRARRAAFGLPLDTVARLAGLQPEKLSAIESGVGPTTWELAAVADALACDPAQLAQGTAEDPRRSVARFRGGDATSNLSSRDLRLLARGAEAGRILAHLKRRLGEQVSTVAALRQVSAPSSAVEPWLHGYGLGEKARTALQPASPIASVQALLESAGVHVAAVDFETDRIDAAALYEVDAAPIILLNRRASRFSLPLARRAVLAHELCHLLYDGGQRDLTVVTRDEDRSAIEQRANGFAPSFIAPVTLVQIPARGSNPEAIVRDLAETWGLSFEGAAWHAKNLKLLDPVTAESLARGRKSDILGSFEADLPRTPPDQFGVDADPTPLAQGLLSETAIIACAEGVISRGRAAEILTFQ